MTDKETLEENKLRQLFKNRSNCYADADDVVQAMDEDCFISTINEWQQEQDKKLYSNEEVLPLLEMLQKCKEYFLLKTDAKSEERADAIAQVIKQFKNI